MKRMIPLMMGILFMVFQCAFPQTNRERRLYLNEYVAPEELVSMSKTLPFDKAMLLFSEFSKKYLNKIIVDATNNKKPIGVDVENTYWLQAFENTLRANSLWYDEREEFFYVYAPGDSSKPQAGGGGGGGVFGKTDTTSRFLFRQRDVRISSVFFTVDVLKSLNAGINWSFFYAGDTTTGPKTQFGSELYSGLTDPKQQGGSGGGTTTIPAGFFGRVVPAIKFANVSALISFFQNNQLGDVLSGPSVIVSSGKEGRIQVGQDFFITSRDFSGNTIQQKQSAGIIITVTPTVYEENNIRFINLNIDAERSTISSAGASPIINKSSAKTFSVLYDGEETVIGGLYTNTESSERGGIPLLKDLPWWFFGLRYVFGFDKQTSSTQELIILMKAEVMPTLEERVANAAQHKGINPIDRERERNAAEMERLKIKEKK
ncbi:MAG: type II and III secretion system protein [Bacteroidota bacterium]|nr:type II and III secretion system protein [Bacteroidota bacterium]